MSVTIRAATNGDAAAIARIHVQTWRDAYAGIVPAGHLAGLSEEARASFWEQRLADRASVVQVAFEGSQMAGWASGGPCRDPDSPGRPEVYGIYVASSHWRRGIGRRLLGALEGMLPGAGPVSLWVLRQNLPAIRFYEALGFIPDGLEKQVVLGGAALAEIRLRRERAHPGGGPARPSQ